MLTKQHPFNCSHISLTIAFKRRSEKTHKKTPSFRLFLVQSSANQQTVLIIIVIIICFCGQLIFSCFFNTVRWVSYQTKKNSKKKFEKLNNFQQFFLFIVCSVRKKQIFSPLVANKLLLFDLTLEEQKKRNKKKKTN